MTNHSTGKLPIRSLKLFGVMLIALLSACSASISVAPEYNSFNSKVAAVLPAQYPAGLSRERVNSVRAALINELRNNGFVIIEDQVVRKVCLNALCMNRKELESKYLVDGFFTLEIASITQSDFLAGYYNSINGKLILSDVDNQTLLTISHRESERGGVLFQSGQVIEGVIDQVENAQDDSFSDLSAKFARRLTAQIPKSEASDPIDDAVAVALNSVEVTPVNPPVARVCASGSSNSLAYLVVNRTRYALRETKPGRYCSIVRLGKAKNKLAASFVELRSVFGNSLKKTVDLSRYGTCDLRGRVRLASNDSAKRISLHCVIPSGRSADNAQQSCEEEIQICKSTEFVVYKAAMPGGVFREIARFSGQSWVDASVTSASPVYEIVALEPSGVQSVPEMAVMD